MRIVLLSMVLLASCGTGSNPVTCTGASCRCPAGDNCSFSASSCGASGSCTLECADGSTCSGSCSQSCSIACDQGATCTVTVGASGSVTCKTGSKCDVTCT